MGNLTPSEQQIHDHRKLNEKVISDLVSEGARLGAIAASAATFADAIRSAAAEHPDFAVRLLAPSREILDAFEHFRDEIDAACSRLRVAVNG